MTCGRKIIPRASCFLASFCLFAAAINQSEPSAGAYIQKAGADGVPVTLSITVLDEKGMPVQELKKDAFSLSENGKPQEILQFAKGGGPLSATLILEKNFFLKSPSLDRYRRAIFGFLEALGARSSAAVVVFDRLVDLACPLTSDRAVLRKSIERITQQPKGSPSANPRDALFLSLRDVVSAQAGRKAVIVLTYGHGDESVTSWDRLLAPAAATDASIYVISYDLLQYMEKMHGVWALPLPRERYIAVAGPEAHRKGIAPPLWGNDITKVDSSEYFVKLHKWQNENYRALTSLSGGWYAILPNNDLQTPFARLAAELDSQYVVTYLAPPGSGTRILQVAVARPGVTIRARREITVAPKPGDAR